MLYILVHLLYTRKGDFFFLSVELFAKNTFIETMSCQT